ncbi:helix-turn-helix domain-containing protein [Nocardia sp. SYP-A9097]|uniref:AraC-like ligand-binding domain-containing protein n=1 Tax=Nocardia sp. SYP-A9097 TaxID=2663237 RepID=UPI00129A7F24|nr:helix-turn-helix domain-containing protein [Nocardia sp. SYP-A9097]MRH88464.1 helix-turn-helix domain-containing protein [Nocardia sp. SYP-A9097]
MVGSQFVLLDALPFQGRPFHGALASAQFGPVLASVISAQPHRISRTPRHIARSSPGYYKVSFQLKGTCRLSQQDKQVLLTPGNVAIYDTDLPYSMQFDDAYSMLVLMFPRKMLGIPESPFKTIAATAVSCDSGVGAVVKPFLTGMAANLAQLDGLENWASATPMARSTVDMLTVLFNDHLNRTTPTAEASKSILLQQILGYIDAHLAEPSLTPDEIAATHHISRRQLYKLFEPQEHTVAGWIRQQRLNRCQEDLANHALADDPVGRIGARWGFGDPAHFSHSFKLAFGMSPRDFRQTCA